MAYGLFGLLMPADVASAHGPDSLRLPRTLPTWAPVIPVDLTGKRSTRVSVEAGGFVSSSGLTPFWLQTNQFGVVPATAPSGLLRVGMQQTYRQGASPRKTDWGYGLEIAGQAGSSQGVILAEAYLKARLGVFEVFGGRRKQIVGLVESPLSSGSFIWSGNALPLPRVQVGIPDYAPLGFTGNWLAVKGFFAHGWFGDGRYVQRSYLHQKAIFLRLGKDRSRVRLYGAFNHQSQWAGYAPFLEMDPATSFGGQIANSLDAYLNVVVPMKTDALKNLSKFTTYDQNRVGDHRGAAELALEVKAGKWSILAYQQHFYERGRKLLNFRNIEDGLYGLRLLNTRKQAAVQEFIVELFNSGNQGYMQFGQHLGGEHEEYFLNGQYPDSWSYRGRTMGTAFISQARDTNPALPRLTFEGTTADNQLIQGIHGINNNRVWALYTGISGNLGARWGYVAKASFSRNYGTLHLPFPAETNQLSTMASLTKSIRWLSGSTMLLSVGYDQGKLLANPVQYGGYLGLRKEWRIRS
ncbi:hypothetical protein GGR92_002483 [Spirosoma lacussanchae]|uniref:capsule assembly Wzi family protein n=1 Tax=Spirosoma lacussanchae TaxID=1884249 RepID=UPI001109E3CE|nr:capsule assembly Wzi family protein [Spirosoma lacussanchae]